MMMEKIVTGRQNEPGGHDDQGLAEELDSLYHRVARLDQEDTSGERSADPLPGDAHAPISPAASPADIRSPETCRELPSGDGCHRPPGHALAERLDRIAGAYEEILSLWPSASNHPPPPLSGEICPEEVNGEIPGNGRSDHRTSTAGRSVFRRHPWSVGAAATTAAIIFLFLLWPTVYHYDSLQVGNKVYPLRINRLTAHPAYFDGKAWVDFPLPGDSTPRQAVNAAPITVPPVMTPPEITAAPPAAADRTEGKAGPPHFRRAEPAPKPIPSPSPAASYPDQGTMPPPVSSQARPNRSTAVKIRPRKERGYTIQIRAFRDEQDARSFADAVKETEPGIHLETILLEGSGVWHRVVVGDFKTENEALKYYTMKKIKEQFPGSFLRESQKGP